MTTAQLIQLCHDNAHAAEHDLEDTLFFSLTRRDCWIVCLGGLLTEILLPCLSDETVVILERLGEVIDTQKQHWRGAA